MPPSPDDNSNRKPVILLGAGGHARVLISLLRLIDRPIAALLDDDPHKLNTTLDGIPITTPIDALTQHPPDTVELVNAIGSAHRPTARQALYEKYTQAGYAFATLLHPAAIIAPQANIQAGAQVMAGAVIQANATLHPNCLINTAASIDHDTTVGMHTHIAPGVTICGGVTLGPCCHIGAGTTVVQGIRLGSSVVVGAGATVLSDIPNNQIVAGTPAKSLDR